MRMDLDPDLIWEYAEAYQAKAKFPPLVVFYDGTDYWLVDGFHRWHAARKAEVKSHRCEVHQGTREDARWYSYAANQTHGLRRSNADKRKAVLAALRHPKGVKLSDNQIASHVGVAQSTVTKYRGELESTNRIDKSPTRTGRDGRTINTSRIGKGGTTTAVAKEAVCPNCKGSEVDEDGDCATCREPDVGESGPRCSQKASENALRKVIVAGIDEWWSGCFGSESVSIAAVLKSVAEEYD
jgi:hypothetical protein